jgi:16S rRNA processing protein RimM
MTEHARRILLGRIVAAHGIRGDVVIESYTDAADGLAAYGPLETDGGTQLEIKVVRTTPKGIIARIGGVADRNAAEALRGTALYASRDQLAPVEEGQYYHADLVGLRAVNAEGAPIGTVVAVQNYGAGDLLELQLEGQRATELIPFTDAFVPIVDVAAGRVVVSVPTYAPDDEDEPS